MKEDVTEADATQEKPDASSNDETSETEDLQSKLDAVTDGKKPPKRFRVVETSDAPVFTDKLIKEKGKKTYTVEFVFDDDIYQIEVRRGMPMEFAVMLQITAEVYALRRKRLSKDNPDAEKQPEVEAEKARLRDEEDRHIKQIQVASLVVRTNKKTKEIAPVFSLNGKGGKIPIEEQSDLLLGAFYQAVMEVQTPEGFSDALSRFQGVSGDDGSGEEHST